MSNGFINSIAYNSIVCASLEQLQRAKGYYEIAVIYWNKQNNQQQANFFKDGLRFIEEKIEKCGN